MRLSAKAGCGMLMMAACAVAWAQNESPGSAASGGSAASAALAASAAPAEDIRDIRAPKSPQAQAQAPVLIIAAVAAAILLMVGFGLWRRRRGRDGVVPLRPFELALQQLDQARSLMQAADGRAFGVAVSDIVRHYIEQQFRVTVTQRTTEEFMHGLMSADHSALAQYRSVLAEFLQQSDVIKFAGGSLSLPDLEALLRTARRLVEETAQAAVHHVSIPAT